MMVKRLSNSFLQFASDVRFLAAVVKKLEQDSTSAAQAASSTLTVLVSCFLALKNDVDVL